MKFTSDTAHGRLEELDAFADRITRKLQIAQEMAAKMQSLDGSLPDLADLAAIVDAARERGAVLPAVRQPEHAAASHGNRARPLPCVSRRKTLDELLADAEAWTSIGSRQFGAQVSLDVKEGPESTQVSFPVTDHQWGEVLALFTLTPANLYRMRAVFNYSGGDLNLDFRSHAPGEMSARCRLEEFMPGRQWHEVEMWTERGVPHATLNGRSVKFSTQSLGQRACYCFAFSARTQINFRELEFVSMLA